MGTGYTNQLWQFESNGNGNYHVANQQQLQRGVGRDRRYFRHRERHAHPDLELDRRHQPAVAAPQQLSNGDLKFIAHNSGNECLDVTNVSTSAGAQMQQWTCSTNNDPAQSFQLVPVS